MRKTIPSILAATVFAAGAWSQEAPGNLVFVEGGTFENARSGFHGRGATISSFYIGRYEVTQKEWNEVMGSNPSQFKDDDVPVEMVSWYDCIEYCNKRSTKEGLEPYYNIDRINKDPNNEGDLDEMKWTVTINAGASGYRLPTEAEWEYAAGGGQVTQGYIYSGGNEIDEVAWYWQNSGDEYLTGLWNWPVIEKNKNSTKSVGEKKPNELGIHDMSGNVREWCWDWYGELQSEGPDPEGSESGSLRVWKGGGWFGGDFCCEPSFRAGFEANGRGPDQGFRVCRDM